MKKQLIDYSLQDVIGQGSYGKVYKGKKKSTGEDCALKIISKKGRGSRQLSALKNQIQLIRKLDHQNIIKLMQSIQSQTQFIIVTQLADGDLSNQLDNRGSMLLNQIKSIVIQIISALLYLNQNRIVHRDLKPQNILIKNAQIKLCDFGFARKLSGQSVVLRSMKGTPLYIAPEIFRQQPYSYKVDIWSLGIIIFQLFTGLPPYISDNYYSLFNKIIHEPVSYPADIDQSLKQLITLMLKKNPQKRADWTQILKTPFLSQKIDYTKPLTFSIQIQDCQRLRSSTVALQPSTINQQDILKFDEMSRLNIPQLRQSLFFYHKILTFFQLQIHKEQIDINMLRIIITILGRISKYKPQHPLQCDIIVKQDLLQSLCFIINKIPQDDQISVLGQIGLILKQKGSFIRQQELDIVFQQVLSKIKISNKMFNNVIKISGIISLTKYSHKLICITNQLINGIDVNMPRQGILILQVAKRLLSRNIPIMKNLLQRKQHLFQLLDRKQQQFLKSVMSLLAHMAIKDNGFIKQIKTKLCRHQISVICPHIQYFLCLCSNIPPPFQSNCSLVGLFHLYYTFKNKKISLEQSKELSIKLKELIKNNKSNCHEDINLNSFFNDYAVDVVLLLDSELLIQDPSIVQLLFTSQQPQALSKQAILKLLIILKYLPAQQLSSRIIWHLSLISTQNNQVPALFSKHLNKNPKSKAGIQNLIQMGWGKHCLQQPEYINIQNYQACFQLLLKMLSKDQSLAISIIHNFQRIKFYQSCNLTSMLSNIARSNLRYYRELDEIGIIGYGIRQIKRDQQQRKQKGLNLIGNLCKYAIDGYNYIEFEQEHKNKETNSLFVRFSDKLLISFNHIVQCLDSSDQTLIQNTIGLFINLTKYGRWISLVHKYSTKIANMLSQKTNRNILIINYLLKISYQVKPFLKKQQSQQIITIASKINVIQKHHIIQLQSLIKS